MVGREGGCIGWGECIRGGGRSLGWWDDSKDSDDSSGRIKATGDAGGVNSDMAVIASVADSFASPLQIPFGRPEPANLGVRASDEDGPALESRSRSEGAMLTLLPRPATTLRTIRGLVTRSGTDTDAVAAAATAAFFSSRSTPSPSSLALSNDDTEPFACSVRVSGFSVSSELRGECRRGYIPSRGWATRS
jgi:hypothetical protein